MTFPSWMSHHQRSNYLIIQVLIMQLCWLVGINGVHQLAFWVVMVLLDKSSQDLPVVHRPTNVYRSNVMVRQVSIWSVKHFQPFWVVLTPYLSGIFIRVVVVEMNFMLIYFKIKERFREKEKQFDVNLIFVDNVAHVEQYLVNFQ